MGARLRTAWTQHSVSAYAWFLPHTAQAARPLLSHLQVATWRFNPLHQLGAEGENRRFWRAGTGYARAAQRGSLLALFGGALCCAVLCLADVLSLVHGLVLRCYGPYPAYLAAAALPLAVLGTPAHWLGLLGLCAAALAHLQAPSTRGKPAPFTPAVSAAPGVNVVPAGLAALPQAAFRAVAALALTEHLRFPAVPAEAASSTAAAPQPASGVLWGSSWARLSGVVAAPLGQTWIELSMQSRGRSVQARVLLAALARQAEVGAAAGWQPASPSSVGAAVAPRTHGLYVLAASGQPLRCLDGATRRPATLSAASQAGGHAAPVFQLLQPAPVWAPTRLR